MLRSLLALIILWSCYALSDQSKAYKIGYFHSPPYVYHSADGPTGILVDITEEIMGAAGIDYQFNYTSPMRFFQGVESGSSTQIQYMVKNAPYEKHLFYSKEAFLSDKLQVIWKKGTAEITNRNELVGKKIIMIQNFSYGGLRSYLLESQPEVQIVEAITPRLATQMLLAGRGEYLISYGSIIDVVDKPSYQFQRQTLSTIDMYITINKNIEGAKELLASLEDEFYKIKYDGRLSNIIRSHLAPQ